MRFFNTAGPVNCKDHYCLEHFFCFFFLNLDKISKGNRDCAIELFFL